MSSVIALHTPLCDTPDAPLPQRYEAARAALAECDAIDECQDWADKAAAMAAYARQSKDESLLVLAKRIHARAVRRCGELLSQIPPSSGGDRGNSATGGRPPVGETRTQAATAAGLSGHQRKTAPRVAAVPASAFESQMESPRPPSVTQLAHQGTAGAHRPYAERPSATRVEYGTPTACEALEAFVRFCGQHEPIRLARRCSLEDAAQLRHYIAKADHWLERLVCNLPA
jgi:hypothetical protein